VTMNFVVFRFSYLPTFWLNCVCMSILCVCVCVCVCVRERERGRERERRAGDITRPVSQ
jgi:hypothetical protein